MKKFFLHLLVCCLFAGLFSCKREPTPQTTNATAKIQAAVDKIRQKLSDSLHLSYPSLSLIIQTPTDKIFVSSHGVTGQVVTPDTYYRFASNTKNFTATAILNMYEDGWLDYKAKITDLMPGSKTATYVPAGADWDFPNKEAITIEQLMQHAAGVYDIDNDPVPGYGDLSFTQAVQIAEPMHQFSTSEMVKVLQQKNLSYFKPGKGQHYSNTGYSILAEIIKRVYTERAGFPKTYADYMDDFITGAHTPVPLPQIHFPILATDATMPDPHLKSTILLPTGPVLFDAYNMSAQLGEGNGYGTMESLHKYFRTLMKGQNVLKPATVKLMQTDVSAGNATYGLGIAFQKNLGYGHSGARLGFLNVMCYDPVYDVSVVVMVPLYDFRTSTSFALCAASLSEAAYAAREVLGYPGKP